MQILLISPQKCCKSDHLERFLKKSGLPYVVKYVDDPGAEEIIGKFGIKASPGIILGEQPIN